MKADSGPIGSEEPTEDPGWPIGFIVLVVAAAAYLLLRLVQMAGWLIDWVR